jgi:hypothetical protein
MSVEFRLGNGDHLKVEDFLAQHPSGVGAIALHATGAKHQVPAAEAAVDAGIAVTYDPRSERLAFPGYGLEKIPGYVGAPYDLAVLAAKPDRREDLVAAVVEAHPDITTFVTPPSFFVEDARVALLNLALAEATRAASDKPIRPIVTFGSRTTEAVIREVAEEYAKAGFQAVDVRFSPLGGENDGIRKIKGVFKHLDIFKNLGFEVTLGQSGNIGQAAVALGHADHYSVGVGQLEQVNHAQIVQRQSKPPKVDENGKKIGGGSWEGIYLPGLALTVSKAVGTSLLGHTDIRTRIGCRIGSCARSVMGPLDDSRSHYLHSRAAEMEKILSQPPAWRSKSEIDRLARAVELRQLINKKYLGANDTQLKTRTLESIIGEIEAERAAAVA